MIIEAVQGEQMLSEKEAVVGPVLLEKKPELLKEYCAFKLRVLKKALEGASQGADVQEAERIKRELEIWEDTSACL